MAALALPVPRSDDVRLGILYMIGSVFLFAIQNAIGKWLAQSYPIPMLVFFRSGVALLPAAVLVWHAGGWPVLRTRRLGAQFGRGAIWGLSNVASFFVYHLLPLADAAALSFAAPLFLTALSWPILRERVGRSRWIAVIVGFLGVLIMARPSGGGAPLGVACGIVAALGSALGSLTVRDLCRTERSESIVLYTALFMTLGSLPALPFYWIDPGLLDFALLCSIGLLGGVSQYWTTQALHFAPAAAVAPFNYTALVWATMLGFMVWGDIPDPPMIAGSAIITATGLYLLRRETSRPRRPISSS